MNWKKMALTVAALCCATVGDACSLDGWQGAHSTIVTFDVVRAQSPGAVHLLEVDSDGAVRVRAPDPTDPVLHGTLSEEQLLDFLNRAVVATKLDEIDMDQILETLHPRGENAASSDVQPVAMVADGRFTRILVELPDCRVELDHPGVTLFAGSRPDIPDLKNLHAAQQQFLSLVAQVQGQ